MKIKTRQHHNSIGNVYVIQSVLDRESAMRWGVAVTKQLVLDQMCVDIIDGKNYHDGTLSFQCSKIENEEVFVKEYLHTPVYLIMISGYFQKTYITIQVNLNLQHIYIDANETAIPQIEELERLLELV